MDGTSQQLCIVVVSLWLGFSLALTLSPATTQKFGVNFSDPKVSGLQLDTNLSSNPFGFPCIVQEVTDKIKEPESSIDTGSKGYAKELGSSASPSVLTSGPSTSSSPSSAQTSEVILNDIEGGFIPGSSPLPGSAEGMKENMPNAVQPQGEFKQEESLLGAHNGSGEEAKGAKDSIGQGSKSQPTVESVTSAQKPMEDPLSVGSGLLAGDGGGKKSSRIIKATVLYGSGVIKSHVKIGDDSKDDGKTLSSSSLPASASEPTLTQAQARYERALQTHLEHAKIHGYQTKIMRKAMYDEVWTKPAYLLSLVLEELAKDEDDKAEWILWFDVDTIVMNPNVPLDIFLPPSPTFDHINLLLTNDHRGLNNGVFFMRVSTWTVEFFSSLLAYRHFNPDVHLQFRDQSAMQNLLESPLYSPRAAYVPMRWFNAYLPSKENLERNARHGDLLVHLAGAKQKVHFDTWLDKADQHLSWWDKPLSSTTYEKRIAKYWSKLEKTLKGQGFDFSLWAQEKLGSSAHESERLEKSNPSLSPSPSLEDADGLENENGLGDDSPEENEDLTESADTPSPDQSAEDVATVVKMAESGGADEADMLKRMRRRVVRFPK
ncbi:hypothetical protein IE53DRAFT_125906 [Violaceomyces palustris]|uniref:Uncharacterized protein n=1 Tax=Violaceomyces palustris TaxID=1673888 RepID=A0ACD0P6V9_9BASI|nr:hypothetical protein IE53DRAFT_125906 [Violaceomyces palustris]